MASAVAASQADNVAGWRPQKKGGSDVSLIRTAARWTRERSRFPPFGRSLYRGLPHDACQVPHWGYLFSGRVRFTFVDGTLLEVGPGEANYAPAGHLWQCIEDAESVEFSPADTLDAHMDVVAVNLARLEAQNGQGQGTPQRR